MQQWWRRVCWKKFATAKGHRARTHCALWKRAAMSWKLCWKRRRRCATGTKARRSPSRPRFSFRSRTSAAISAATARSAKRRTKSARRRCRSTKSSPSRGAGKLLGCTEALFSLGDKPEAIYPEMKAFLARVGLKRTLDYLYDACKAALAQTGILPHAHPGIMGSGDLRRLKEANPSMGLMLESTSERLMRPGGAHDNAPDKKPALRLRTIAAAGKLRIPFTTGILIGIGETWEERIDSLFAVRELDDRYGHIQEVIVQNFRPKPEIPMRDWPAPARDDMLKTIALARLILSGKMNQIGRA